MYITSVFTNSAFCHDLGHQRAESMLPPHIRLAYDGLEIVVG